MDQKNEIPEEARKAISEVIDDLYTLGISIQASVSEVWARLTDTVKPVINAIIEAYTAMIPDQCPICKGTDMRNDPEVGYSAFYCAYCDWKNWKDNDD